MAIGKVMHVGCLLAFTLWGSIANNAEPILTCILPIAFSNTNYVPLCCDWVNNSAAPYSLSVSIDYANKTVKAVKATAQNKNPRGIGWVAFGV